MNEERVRTTERRPVARREVRGRHEQDRRRGGVPWWVWLIGLLAIGIVAFMVFAGRGSVDEEGGSAGSVSEETTGGGTAAGATAAEGTLTAGGTDLLPAASSGSDLAGYEGDVVDGRAVTVESVVADEGFWVGSSVEERVFVFLNLKDESGPEIDAGDRVDLSGTMTAVPDGFAEGLGVTDEEGAGQLEQQGSYIEATQIEKVA